MNLVEDPVPQAEPYGLHGPAVLGVVGDAQDHVVIRRYSMPAASPGACPPWPQTLSIPFMNPGLNHVRPSAQPRTMGSSWPWG